MRRKKTYQHVTNDTKEAFYKFYMERNEVKKKEIKVILNAQIQEKFSDGATDKVNFIKTEKQMEGTHGRFQRLKRLKNGSRLRSQHSYFVYDAAAYKNTKKVQVKIDEMHEADVTKRTNELAAMSLKDIKIEGTGELEL